MTLVSPGSVLFYWSSLYGPTARIGGKPTHSRNSAARWIDGQGVVQSALVNTPRMEHADLGDGALSREVMRLEQARTNSIAYSEQFDNAAWTRVRTSISANATIAPDGTLTADKAVEDSSNSTHEAGEQPVSTSASTLQTISVFAKAAGRNFLYMEVVGKDGVARYSYFDLSAGVLGVNSGPSNIGIIPVGNGWYRCFITATSGAGGATPRVTMYIASASGTVSYAGDGVSGIYLWGAQWEADQPTLSAYIGPTLGAGISRSGDQFYWDFSAPPQAMMFYCRFIERGSGQLGAGVFSITTTSESIPLIRCYSTGATYIFAHWGSVNSVATLGGSVVPYGTTVELIGIVFPDGHTRIIQSLNGAAVTSAADATTSTLQPAWSGPQLFLNGRGSTAPGCNDFAELKVVKYADVVGSTDADIMAELRAFELDSRGVQL